MNYNEQTHPPGTGNCPTTYWWEDHGDVLTRSYAINRDHFADPATWETVYDVGEITNTRVIEWWPLQEKTT